MTTHYEGKRVPFNAKVSASNILLSPDLIKIHSLPGGALSVIGEHLKQYHQLREGTRAWVSGRARHLAAWCAGDASLPEFSAGDNSH